jgi:hypothetical protein
MTRLKEEQPLSTCQVIGVPVGHVPKLLLLLLVTKWNHHQGGQLNSKYPFGGQFQ